MSKYASCDPMLMAFRNGRTFTEEELRPYVAWILATNREFYSVNPQFLRPRFVV
jgi:hypothetical protein